MIEPLRKRVVIKRDPVITEINGLFVPKSAQKEEQSGTILAIGSEVTDVVVGDRVIFGKFDGTDLPAQHAEENCIILNEEQIKGIYV